MQLSYHLCFQRFLLLDWTRIVRITASFFKVIYIDCSSSTRATTLLGGDGSRDNGRASLQNREEILALQHAVVAPDRVPFPVITAVYGQVIGLGVDLISACDIRYAASNSVELNVNHFVELADDSEQAFKALKPGFFFHLQ